MCEINWILLLEYFKVLLSWPPIALVIALIFFKRFQPAITNLLGRITGGNFLGQEFKAEPPNQSLESGDEKGFIEKATEGKANDDTDEATTVEAPAPLPPELVDDPKAQAGIEWIKNNPELTLIEYKRLSQNFGYERLFNIIYGTQVSLLELLAARPNETFSLTQLTPFHLNYLSKQGSTAYALQDYVSFLVGHGVIAESIQPHQQTTYSITPSGIQFLSYIKANYPSMWYQRAY